jgi:hypothetical protein
MNDVSQGSDDLWNWVVIGIVCGAAALALFAPLILEFAHGA